MAAQLTIREYLEGQFEENAFSEANFKFIFAKYDIDGTADFASVSEESRDLALADLHEIFANKSNGSGRTEKRGDMSISEHGYSMTNADRLFHRNKASEFRKKWGIETNEEICEFHSITI